MGNPDDTPRPDVNAAPAEYRAPQTNEACALAEKKAARRAADAERRRFDPEAPLLTTLTAGALGKLRLRDAVSDEYTIAEDIDDAIRIADAMSFPMLSPATTRDEILAFVFNDVDPETATFSLGFADEYPMPVWLPVAPVPLTWTDDPHPADIPFPDAASVDVVAGKKLTVYDIEELRGRDAQPCRGMRGNALLRGRKVRETVMAPLYEVELTALRTHYAGMKYATEIEYAPEFSVGAIRGYLDALDRLPPNAVKSVNANRKAGLSTHNALTLTYAIAYAYECDLHVIDVHAFNKDGECSCVFPPAKPSCFASPGKHPRGPGWQKRATTDTGAIITWWKGEGFYDATGEDAEPRKMGGKNAPRNVGIAFPVGGRFFAVDVDGDKGKAGLRALEEEYGPLPSTPKSISGSGTGFHLLFKAPEGVTIRNSASSLAPGVDIRGENGQIVAPPSLHKSGNLYRWEDDLSPWETPIADAPDWLVDLVCLHAKAPAAAKSTGKRKRTVSAKRDTSGVKVGRTYKERLAQIGDGDGQRGFHAPIYEAAIQFYRENLPDT